MNNMLMDSYGRVITSLRVSITQRCNLNCIFCHEEGEERNPEREISLDTIVKIITTATEFGVKKVKFSGGEPLMKNDNLIEIKDEATPDEIREMIKDAAKIREPYYKNNLNRLCAKYETANIP